MKRLLCALLALVLALVCVPAMADDARVTEEPKEFTVWAAYNPTYQTEWESIKAWKYFEEATGVHINWVLFSNDEMSEKLNTLIGSADFEHFPDAFYRCWISDSMLKRFGPDGMFLDLKELTEPVQGAGRNGCVEQCAGPGDRRNVLRAGTEQRAFRPDASQNVL